MFFNDTNKITFVQSNLFKVLEEEKANPKHTSFFGGGWGSNSEPDIYYVLSISTELNSRRQQ